MELRRHKLQAMRNQLSDDSPRVNSQGHRNLGKCQGETESQSETVECTNNCGKSDDAKDSAKSPPIIAMETRNIAVETGNIAMETQNIDEDEWEEATSVADDEFQVAPENTRPSDRDNLDTTDGRTKEACCKLVSGVDVTTLSRICELNASRGNTTSAALLHSKQPDIVESVLPSCRIEPTSPVAPPRRKKKHAPLPPLTRIDVDVSVKIFLDIPHQFITHN